ncbi:MAG: hypothetical protein RR527_02480 [Clostridia bacterium]
MDWINIYGLIFIIIFMIPNIIFAMKNKDGFDNLWHNKVVEILEQIGRFSCITFMVVNIPFTWFGFWFEGALSIYLVVNSCLTVAYCTIWFVCFHKNSVFRALMLSILPSIIFLFSGVLILSIPLIIAAIIFTPCHILISYKNATLVKK